MELKRRQDEDLEVALAKRQRLDDERAEQILQPSPISVEQRFWTAAAEPPDLDYRDIIEEHTKIKKHYSGNSKVPYEERCAWVDFYDTTYLERSLIEVYEAWIYDKAEAAEGTESFRDKRFWNGLSREILVDQRSIDAEYNERIDFLLNVLPSKLNQ